MHKYLFFLLALWLGFASAPAQAQTLSPLGVWTNAEKKATFEIYKCGEKLCGKIVTLTVPNDPATGKPKMDTQNPDPKLRTRPRLAWCLCRVLATTVMTSGTTARFMTPKAAKPTRAT